MLLIFAFSVTPKLFLHDLVVHHKDTPIPLGKYAQVSNAGFHCDCESQVVDLPYVADVAGICLTAPVSFPTHQTRAAYQFHSFPHFIFGLRGPPLSL